MTLLQSDRNALPLCRTLRPWFVPTDGDQVFEHCRCDCAWTRVLAALQEAGPVALALPARVTALNAPSILAASLALGSDWTLRAVVTPDGVDESLRWDGAGRMLEVHALPSSNWRPFDRLAQMHRCAGSTGLNASRAQPGTAVPLLVDDDFNMRLLNWSTLTRLDQDEGDRWMRRRGLRALHL